MLKKILLIILILCNSFIVYCENNQEDKSKFDEILEKYQKFPNDDFTSDISYIKSNIKELKKLDTLKKEELLLFVTSIKPNIVINWLENKTIKNISRDDLEYESITLAIINIFISKGEKNSINILKKIALSDESPTTLKGMAGIAHDFIAGTFVKEKYDKSTPKLFILSLNSYIKKNKNKPISDNLKEFFIYPRYCDDFWEYEQKPKMIKAKDELDKLYKIINEIADDFINNSGKNIIFIKKRVKDILLRDSVIIKLNNKRALELQQDCFGQWRF